jgi:hypothetical protein
LQSLKVSVPTVRTAAPSANRPTFSSVTTWPALNEDVIPAASTASTPIICACQWWCNQSPLFRIAQKGRYEKRPTGYLYFWSNAFHVRCYARQHPSTTAANKYGVETFRRHLVQNFHANGALPCNDQWIIKWVYHSEALLFSKALGLRSCFIVVIAEEDDLSQAHRRATQKNYRKLAMAGHGVSVPIHINL